MIVRWVDSPRVRYLGQGEAVKTACKESCVSILTLALFTANPLAINAAYIACVEACIQGSSQEEMGKAAEAAAKAAEQAAEEAKQKGEPPPEPRTPEPAPTAAEKYPLGSFSPETVVLQGKLNGKLVPKGFCPIATDGKLGPATCGAADAVAPEKKPPTCVASAPPKKPPCAAAVKPAPPPPPAAPAPTEGSSVSPFLYILGAAAAFAFVAAVIPTPKRRQAA